MREYANPVGPQYGPGAAPCDEMYAQVVEGFPDAAKAEFRAIDMKPGSVLYIPRGTWHRTVAEEDSFAISIGLNPPSIAEAFLAQMRYLLLQDPAWRRPLYATRGEGEAQALAEVLQSAARAAAAVAPRDLRPLTELERLASIDRSSRFQPEAGARLAFAPGQDVFEVRVPAGNSEQTTLTMNFPRECAALCRWLATRKAAFSAGELAQAFPALPFLQLTKLLDVLTRAKYLRQLWCPRLPAGCARFRAGWARAPRTRESGR